MMVDVPKLIADLVQKRDEMRVQLHLAGKEAEEEWDALTTEWDAFLTRAQFDKSREEVGEAALQLGLRMKDTYDRFKKAV